MRARVILTVAPEFETAALAEVREAGVQVVRRSGIQGQGAGHPDIRALPGPDALPSQLAPGILLLESPGGFGELARFLREHPPLFVRHIQPVDRQVPIAGAPEDLERLAAAALELAPRVDPRQPFSVQTRLTAALLGHAPSTPAPYGRYEVNERLAAALGEATKAPLDVRAPAQVLSVLVTPGLAYVGLSRTEENLSTWAGGAIRFAREPDQVSRSEFKLLEALRAFSLSLPEAGSALDLGAAPGGWTRLLRRAGLEVTAVDPGDLDPRVAADPGVRHRRTTAQEFRCRRGEFAVIVNDMRMDARDSARLMLGFASCLATYGLVVMTLKLPHRAAAAVARQALELLRTRYRLLGARHLYHNRSEITAALQPLGSSIGDES